MEQISYPYWEVILVFGDGVLSVITEYPYGSSIKFISLQMLVGVSRSMCYFEGCFPHALYAERLNWEKVYVVPAHGLEGNRRRNEQPKHSSSRYQMEISDQLHAPADLLLSPGHPLNRRLSERFRFLIGKCPVRIQLLTSTLPIEVFCRLPQGVQVYGGFVPEIRQSPQML